MDSVCGGVVNVGFLGWVFGSLANFGKIASILLANFFGNVRGVVEMLKDCCGRSLVIVYQMASHWVVLFWGDGGFLWILREDI